MKIQTNRGAKLIEIDVKEAPKPCPFCGGEAELVFTNTSVPHPYVRCKTGDFLTPRCHGVVQAFYDYKTADEAIEAWNRRTEVRGD